MPPRAILSICISLLIVAPLSARPAHKQALANHFGPLLAAKLYDCRTCHLPGSEEDRPHNDFGKRLNTLREEWKASGKKGDILARIEAIAAEDADKDGVPNLSEILLGRLPGDANDTPTADDLRQLPDKQTALAKLRASYPWRPFEKVQRPAVPNIGNGWVRNPIDAFIAAEHHERGLRPRPEASKAILLRRVYMDLIGLPPTRDELNAFLNDASPDAYEKVVDRLLQSPQYGERWGRHWMDVWRYSDWAGWGSQVRDSQPHIWRWRDWIVESLTADKPYDRMIIEMLAADEVAPLDTDALRATGYLVRNYKLLSREKWMQDVVDHTFLAFQGLTLGCARCHDHMYDPVTQQEYYRVRAIFEPHHVRTDRLPGKGEQLVRAFDKDLAAKTVLFIRGDDRTPDKEPLAPGVPASLGGDFPDALPAINLPLFAQVPDKRPFLIEETLAEAVEAVRTAEQAWQRASARALLAGPVLRKTLVDDAELLQLTAVLMQAKRTSLDAVLLVERLEDAGDRQSEAWKNAAMNAQRAQRQQSLAQLKVDHRTLELTPLPKDANQAKAHQQKLATVAQAIAKAEMEATTPATTAYTRRTITQYPATSTGRRLALARWIAHTDNPLTARVAMNHLWLRHFGAGLVPNVFDFGRNGRAATHPALLDWLAAEFMERNWSMRAMHKLMVTSATYRQASTPDDANLVKDRDNIYLWRMNARRVEAEVVRDQLYYVAGKLDLTRGGPELDHMLGLSIPRRSLYFRHAAEKQMEFLKIFDAAGVTECYQRKDSVIPQQAMALSNSDLSIRHARILARRLGGDDGNFVHAAIETVLARPATADEVRTCLEFLAEQSAKLPRSGATLDPEGKTPAGDPNVRARENLVLALFNHHDFVTVR